LGEEEIDRGGFTARGNGEKMVSIHMKARRDFLKLAVVASATGATRACGTIN